MRRMGRGRSVATAVVFAAVFLPHIVGGLYRGLGRQLPDAFPTLSSLFIWLSVTTWFGLYSQRQHIPWVMDMGWFLSAAWIIVIPYYVLKCEGRPGLVRIGLFCFSWFAAWATGWAVFTWTRILAGDVSFP